VKALGFVGKILVEKLDSLFDGLLKVRIVNYFHHTKGFRMSINIMKRDILRSGFDFLRVI